MELLEHPIMIILDKDVTASKPGNMYTAVATPAVAYATVTEEESKNFHSVKSHEATKIREFGAKIHEIFEKHGSESTFDEIREIDNKLMVVACYQAFDLEHSGWVANTLAQRFRGYGITGTAEAKLFFERALKEVGQSQGARAA